MINNSTRIKWRRRHNYTLILMIISACAAFAANAKPPTLIITVRAGKLNCHNAPVTVELPPTKMKDNLSGGYLMLMSKGGGKSLRGQIEVTGGRRVLTFVLDDLPAGKERTYTVNPIVFIRRPDNQVEIVKKGEDIEISEDKKLFTRYVTSSGDNKPYFYPILTPDGDHITRRWKVEPDAVPGESHDHPHHRGLWFTHSSVNGVDFWSEQGAFGKTVNTSFENIRSGWAYGGFRAHTEWRTPDDKLIATDTRDVNVYLLPKDDRLLDFSITIKPVGGPLIFGDNKDGVFGLRTTDSLAITADKSAQIKGEGHILTSTGAKDKDAWGKPAEWVDYWGRIGGKTYGVAIMDGPQNIRHPETWHARDYGLFTINPFGLHDFGRGEKGAGDYTVPANGSLTFHFRVLFHRGDTTVSRIAEQYSGFADPPIARARYQ